MLKNVGVVVLAIATLVTQTRPADGQVGKKVTTADAAARACFWETRSPMLTSRG
jgi:hypothetical protein